MLFRSEGDGLATVDAQAIVVAVERLELADIGLALQRLDGDDYGLCVDCGEAIAFERLRVQPQALRCIGCEQARETRAGTARHATL